MQHLNLSECSLQSNGTRRITAALKNVSELLYLNLQLNYVTDQSAAIVKDIAAAINSNKGIKYLYLPHCHLDNDSMKILLKGNGNSQFIKMCGYW